MDSSTVRDPVRRRLALTIERIVQRTPELSSPRYFPTFWAAGMWPNLALLMIKQVMMMMMMMDDDSNDDNDGRGWMSASETASGESVCGRGTAARSQWTGRRTQRLTSCLGTPPS